MEHWTSETDGDGIAWLRLDKADSKVNVLSSDVLLELDSFVDSIAPKQLKGLVVYSGKSTGFVMGADISEFTSVDDPKLAYEVTRKGQQLMSKIEALDCPTVAALNGFALGGGLELAMAFDYRLALASKKRVLGLPEVKLGLHPGFGGTVRIIQICGVQQGMPIMLTGAPITVDKARKIGLVDRIATEDNWRQAAKELIAAAAPKHTAPLVDKIMNIGLLRPLVKSMLIKQVAGKARKDHYPAPYAMIDLWARFGASTKTGYEGEARSFAQLMCSSTSRNLVRVFFLQSKLKSQGKKTEKKIEHVHVVGAGVMGGDIAAWCALRGHSVTLQDREEKYIEPAMGRAQKLFAKRVRDEGERAATSARLVSDVNGDGVAKADLVIEAIFENLEAKQTLYQSLAKNMKPDALLATNTSSIRLEELRTVLDKPEKFIGIHFFNPVALMPLVEVIRCSDTDQESLDQGFSFVKGIGKFPLECLSFPGFVVNRILAPYMAEAMYLAESGVPLVAIDKAAEKFGMPMGPVELIDSVGIDVALHVSKVLGAASNRPIPAALEEMVEKGHLGRKSGRGFYEWKDGKAIKPAAQSSNVADDLEDRLILPMVNEAIACLADGVVSDSDLLDAGVIFGTGFAPFRGGPVNYARERGLDAVKSRLEELASAHGDRFTPNPGWSDL
ncbi:MAG: 3-hydroxyacyl-CoA dehydrogenase NAD-binding domain-containing protein [Woeseiaceae bacterium]|nr:3-hydroxyacyl-CoA dehydrogenase NAD-binding domain-containing protein [Woeseiaceae bacterium]MDX2608907.1 3-hydroxyacyl-CoA dehydrogenase NAD-binding domain-containing protein [Woeseiaceae bacterium]